MDMNLPDANGIETSRRILAFDPEATIVMISAMKDASLMTQGREAGIHAFLQKPVKPNEIIDILIILCQKKGGAAVTMLRDSYVTTFAQALQRSLFSLLGMESEIEISVDESPYLTIKGIAVIIGLTGSPMGRAVIHMDTDTMRRFALRMLAMDEHDDIEEDEINDSVEESANIIVGRGVSKVNDIFRDKEMRLTPPGTISGANIRIANPKLTSFEVVAKTEIGNICLNLGFAEGE
jgi:chemotaxis protein CheY